MSEKAGIYPRIIEALSGTPLSCFKLAESLGINVDECGPDGQTHITTEYGTLLDALAQLQGNRVVEHAINRKDNTYPLYLRSESDALTHAGVLSKPYTVESLFESQEIGSEKRTYRFTRRELARAFHLLKGKER